jgi:hypothetical protein
MAGQTRIGPLARVGAYLGNVGKEGSEALKAWNKSFDASAGIGAGAEEKAARTSKKAKAEQGQFFGALLQGRRYNKKGQQQ